MSSAATPQRCAAAYSGAAPLPQRVSCGPLALTLSLTFFRINILFTRFTAVVIRFYNNIGFVNVFYPEQHVISLIYLQAKDPENEPVNYSIVSGNDLRQFAIGANTGIITVIRRLDREVLTRYQLVSTHNISTYTYKIKI